MYLLNNKVILETGSVDYRKARYPERSAAPWALYVTNGE